MSHDAHIIRNRRNGFVCFCLGVFEREYGLSGELRLLRCVVYIVFSVLVLCVCVQCVCGRRFLSISRYHI